MMMRRQDADTLARLVTAIRLDWDYAGVIAALRKVESRELVDVARAALNAAAEPTNRTPAVIALAGQHWVSSSQAPRTTEPPRLDDRCTTHLGPAANCPGCRADQLAGDQP